MELDYIREFVTLTETRSFAETAERLFSTQSTISKHLKQIETELGVRLFDRTSRQVRLNEYGRLFLPYARQLLSIQYDYQTAFYNHLEGVSGSLTLGSIPSMSSYHITDIILRFKQENTRFSLDVIEEESATLLRLLQEHTCELAFVRETKKRSEDLAYIPYFTDHLVALLPANHRLISQKKKASIEKLPLEKLQNEDFLFIREKTYLYQLCLHACEEAGFTPHIVFSGHHPENIADLVSKGMGVALLMARQAAELIGAGKPIQAIDLAPETTSRISLVYQKGRRLSPAAEHFLRCVQQS